MKTTLEVRQGTRDRCGVDTSKEAVKIALWQANGGCGVRKDGKVEVVKIAITAGESCTLMAVSTTRTPDELLDILRSLRVATVEFEKMRRMHRQRRAA